MRTGALLALLLLASCSSGQRRQTPAEAYRDPANQIVVALGIEGLFGPVCMHEVRLRSGGTVHEPIASDQCYRFKSPKRIDGIWHKEFEGSFLLTPEEWTNEVGAGSQGARWLEIEYHREVAMCGGVECAAGDYRISFIGRQTLVDGGYGHMGGARELVLLDRLIAIEPLPAHNPPMAVY